MDAACRDHCCIPLGLAGAEDWPACRAVVGGSDRGRYSGCVLHSARPVCRPRGQRPECRFHPRRQPVADGFMGQLFGFDGVSVGGSIRRPLDPGDLMSS